MPPPNCYQETGRGEHYSKEKRANVPVQGSARLLGVGLSSSFLSGIVPIVMVRNSLAPPGTMLNDRRRGRADPGRGGGRRERPLVLRTRSFHPARRSEMCGTAPSPKLPSQRGEPRSPPPCCCSPTRLPPPDTAPSHRTGKSMTLLPSLPKAVVFKQPKPGGFSTRALPWRAPGPAHAVGEKNTNSQPLRPGSPLQRELSTHPQRQVQHLKEEK
ncbi:uncharacterized protein LOC116999955 [Catharus ustulatus]|uniref:uncharacterized protein LOC116999955 n=1 Tax=Catharus ustulatus TaxID=91951 RepID=UPI00140BD1E8|nr:uncharacterized protein LOC116999955 [Catharus ustulatus]